MAESVDALVSNTSGAIHPGSIPGLGTKQAAKRLMFNRFAFFVIFFVNLFANVVFFSYLCSDFVCMYLRAYAAPMRTKGTKSVLSS